MTVEPLTLKEVQELLQPGTTLVGILLVRYRPEFGSLRKKGCSTLEFTWANET